MTERDATEHLLASPANAARLAESVKQARAVSGWQPIATAPRDGSRIILSLYRGRSNVWVVEDGWNVDDDTWSDDPGLNPTHWMPLPEPPEGAV